MKSSLTRRALLLAAAPLAFLPRAARGAEAPDSDPDAVTREHLTAIHKGLVKYLKAHNGVWPLPPSGKGIAAAQKWWPAALEPYGVKPGDWTDPREDGKTPENRMTYSLASFGKAPGTAYLFPDQPWAMTSAPSRAGGEYHLLFPDGRVMTRDAHLAKVESSTPLPPGAEGETVRRMRNIRNALYQYLKAHGGLWPQVPDSVMENPEIEAEIRWRQEVFGPHGTKPGDWEDPMWKPDGKPGWMNLTMFEPEPHSANTWLFFPWLMSASPKEFLRFSADGRIVRNTDHSKIARIYVRKGDE